MATATSPRVRKHLSGIRFKATEQSLFVTPTGLRHGSKGKVLPVGVLLGTLTKGQARRVRKALRRMGESHKAGLPCQQDPQIADLMAKLEQHHKRVENFYADPMTKYCPCTDDFQENFDHKCRKLAADLHKRAYEIGDKKAQDFAWGILEQWTP